MFDIYLQVDRAHPSGGRLHSLGGAGWKEVPCASISNMSGSHTDLLDTRAKFFHSCLKQGLLMLVDRTDR